MVEVGRARGLGDGDLAGVDQIRIDSVTVRLRTHAEHPVLGVQDHPAFRLEEVCDPGGLADAEVQIGARWDVRGDQPGKIISTQRARPVE